MTESDPKAHSRMMTGALAAAGSAPRAEHAHSDASAPRVSFERLYEENVDYVWRVVRRLGVPESGTDDALQDTFLVAHRRLGEFEGRSSLRTWLYGIALRVARDHRRRARRPTEPLPEAVATDEEASPEARTERAEAVRLLDRLLGELDDEKREVFVLAEVEQLTGPQIAEILGVKENTVYSRLRLARERFERAVRRERAKESWRTE